MSLTKEQKQQLEIEAESRRKDFIHRTLHDESFHSFEERANFMAQVQVESHDFKNYEEDLHYKHAEVFLGVYNKRNGPLSDNEVQKNLNNPVNAGNTLYGGNYGKKNLGNDKPGDGFKYRGEGPIQITGKANTQAVATKLHRPDIMDNPALLKEPETGFRASASIWELRPQLRHDEKNVFEASFEINGGYNNFDERVEKNREYHYRLAQGWKEGMPDPLAPLKPGDHGPRVTQLQQNLNKLNDKIGNGRHIAVTGFYDAATEKEIKQFQKDHSHREEDVQKYINDDLHHKQTLKKLGAQGSDKDGGGLKASGRADTSTLTRLCEVSDRHGLLNITPTLSRGDTSPEVEHLQKGLIATGYLKDPEFIHVPSYGAETQAALKAFQKDHGLTQDGKLGPQTSEKLFNTSIAAIQLKPGAEGPWVGTLQEQLIAEGYLSKDRADHKEYLGYGTQTEQGVKKYQQDKGLIQDGIYDADSRRSFTNDLKNQQDQKALQGEALNSKAVEHTPTHITGNIAQQNTVASSAQQYTLPATKELASGHVASDTKQTLEHTPKTNSQTSGSQQFHEATHSAAIIPAFARPEKLHKATLKDVAPVTHEQTVHEHQAAHRASSPLLKEGSHGNEVMEAQKKLNALHYKGPSGADLAADKIFGRATEFAVRNFQKENGLTADGLIGPKTHEALNSPTAKAAPDMSRSAFAEKKATQVPEPSKTPFNAEAYWQNIIRKGTQTSTTGQQITGEHIAQDQTQTQDQNRSMGFRR